ncbi:MAG: hypothetical protein PVF33_11530 [Candidatus Latescibacterota bacterium]|jgi:hypothetical protein
MRKLLLTTLIVVVALMWTATSSSASREVVVKPVDSTEATTIIVGPGSPSQACQVGNLNPAAWAISDFVAPPEDYKLAFDPTATCADCPVGIDVNTIYIHLQTAGACDIVMSIDVEEATYPNGPDCPEPGAVACASGLFTVSLPSAGGWIINLPIECDCLTMDRMYLLSVHFESTSCNPVPDLVTSNGANLCTNWNNYGAGWYDLLVQYTSWPGDLRIWADADCCTPPVPVEQSTWGAIKGMYKK